MHTTTPARVWGRGRALFLGLALLALAAPVLGRQGGEAKGGAEAPTVVVLVCHAEKEAGDIADAPLSDAGRARAQRLAARFAGDGCFGVVVATQYRRTQETAGPIAAKCGVGVTTVEVKQVDSHAAAVAALLRERGTGKRSLYVGHSNTIAAVAGALGADASGVHIDESAYDQVVTVTITPDGKAALAQSTQ